ncbi:hypothetical protein H8356DRAFT_1395591 [Neocallimastix lanati (nom. inval.)]|uniref:Peptidoglycan binding-like domain-containing protein n=1 Tax=Neocallimastix californiae TaxID=1754190 RepID=A0A1Y2EC78_9FUNG|nr:hypothetical protein H8356DRAFT_1395591 [Neocallimastix sp. JGI-2020a]ORY69189.1 hypothetical protein LY90DRAFT_504264 [Neocallimastix californiae]|eukprot:ORY69189.1 hypothetical protein LY90DRAFT_504264 [Neocallimastix californiae]
MKYSEQLFLNIFNLFLYLFVSKCFSKKFKSLKITSKGDTVKECQKKLISLNYFCGECGADGDFGSNMDKCVKEFQINNDLSATGEIDEETYNKLFSDNSIKSNYEVIESKKIFVTKLNINAIPNTNNTINNKTEINRTNSGTIINSEISKADGITLSEFSDIVKDIGILINVLEKAIGLTFTKSSYEVRRSNPYENDDLICIIDNDIRVIYGCYFHKNFPVTVEVIGTWGRTEPSQGPPGKYVCAGMKNHGIRKANDECIARPNTSVKN